MTPPRTTRPESNIAVQMDFTLPTLIYESLNYYFYGKLMNLHNFNGSFDHIWENMQNPIFKNKSINRNIILKKANFLGYAQVRPFKLFFTRSWNLKEGYTLRNQTVTVPMCIFPIVQGSQGSQGSTSHHQSLAMEFIPPSTRHFQLTMCTIISGNSYPQRNREHLIVKNENNHFLDSHFKKRLLNWLEYHTMVGFQHFYIYDDTLSDKKRSQIFNLLYAQN